MNLAGGLGNQMFMYAFGRAQAARYSQKLYFTTHTFAKNELGRKYRLDKLNITNDMRFVDQDPCVYMLFNAKRLMFESIIRMRKESKKDIGTVLKYAKMGYFYSLSSEYIKPVFVNRYINYYNATFQSEKYFASIRDQVKNELKPRKVTEKCSTFGRKLQDEQSVCVHIRRSDYCTDPSLNVCGKKYYIDAIAAMRQKLHSANYYFFSEDIEWVKKNFRDERFYYVDFTESEIEDLYLMSKCRHFIIPNSSFSWWGQYLSENCGGGKKIVIAPSRWYPAGKQAYPLYTDSWTLIDPTPWGTGDR